MYGNKNSDADALFKRLDVELFENIDSQYFNESREFRSLMEVLEVLGQKVDQISRNDASSTSGEDLLAVLKDRNPTYNKLLNQRKIVEAVIEDVVKFQHGGLNNSVDTMSEVVREYTRGKDDISGLRKSLFETQSVLTAKKLGQVPLKELWLKKVELSESLRMVKELENLKSTPHRVQRLMQQKRYLTAVNSLNKAISTMFGEDLVAVQGLSMIREQIMDLKETLLETCVAELKTAVVGSDFTMRGYVDSGSDSDEDDHPENDSVSVSNHSNLTGSHYNNAAGASANNNDIESRSVLSRRSSKKGGVSIHTSYHRNPLGISESMNWSLDLLELDESLEISLSDPSTTGSLYIRLLVRTIGVLQCEEDVERMVLEGLSKTFKSIGLRNLRNIAIAMLEKQQSLKSTARSNEKSSKSQYGRSSKKMDSKAIDLDELSLHSKLFSIFMSSLLDCSALSFKRLLYLMKLLYISKAQRSTDMTSIANVTDNNKHLSESHKRQIISVWLDIEEAIIHQMLNHLVEPDVQEISDVAAVKGNTKAGVRKNGHSLGGGFARLERDFDEDDDDGVPTDAAEGLAVEGDTLPLSALIFLPSARHAAPIYKLVVNHNQQVQRLLNEYRFEDLLSNMLAQRSAALNGANSKVSGVSRAGQSIFTTVQAFLEHELIPVIQSNVNHNMREIQMNNKHFSVYEIESESSKLRNNESAHLCQAANLCHNSAKPLFSYWLQLQQHRVMVATVLERLIRGYASAAREEFEALTFSLTTVKENNVHLDLVQSFKQDPIFKVYRAKLWGTNKYNVDDFFSIVLGTSSSQSTNPSSSMLINTSTSNKTASIGNIRSNSYSKATTAEIDDVKGMNALEISIWNESEYFYVGGKNYPITSQKIAKDFPAISTITSIAYSSDWLIKKLHTFCVFIAKKLHQSGDGTNAANSPSKSSKTNSVKNLVFNKKLPGSNESKVMLFNSVLSGAKELSKLAEEGFALLRGELQIICFYFLHRLAHVTYMPDPDKSYQTTKNGKVVIVSKNERERQAEDAGTAEEEAILNAFTEHVHQFLKSVISCSSPEFLAVLLSPLCSIIPLILTRVAMHMADSSENDSDEETDDVDLQASNNHKLKTRLLRLVVSVQHTTAIHMQSYAILPETKRKLLDTLTEGFERSRRFITMFDMPADELKEYLKGHNTEFTREETEILWMKCVGREITFTQLWNELSTVPRTGPRVSSPLQLGKSSKQSNIK